MSAAAERRFDPANDRFYAISEDDELRLKTVASAAEGLGVLYHQELPDGGIADEYVGALFLTLSYAISGAMERSRFVAPTRQA